MAGINEALLISLGFAKVSQTLTGPYVTWPLPLQGGTLLTCHAPWVDSTYQWYRDGVAISGQTGVTYTVTPSDSSKSITCVAGGTKLRTGVVSVPFISTVPFGFPAEPTRPYLEP